MVLLGGVAAGVGFLVEALFPDDLVDDLCRHSRHL
jgi:hypothetical protein